MLPTRVKLEVGHADVFAQRSSLRPLDTTVEFSDDRAKCASLI